MSRRAGYDETDRFTKTPGWVRHLAARDDDIHDDDDEFAGLALDSAWTQLDTTGTATWTVKRDLASGLIAGQSASDCSALLKPIASGTNVVIEVAWRVWGSLQNYIMLGPVFSTGVISSSNVIWQMTWFPTNDFSRDIRSGTFTNISSDHNQPGTSGQLYTPFGHLYQRFEYDSTLGFRQFFSIDGISFDTYSGGYVTNPLGGAPTHMGMGYSTWGESRPFNMGLEYFRVNPT